MKKALVVGATAIVLLTASAWRAGGQAAPVPVGQPIAGITPHEFERFRLGLEDFLEVETSEDGLGPAYNGTSCGVCHSIPAVGGSGLTTEVRFGVRNAAGVFGPPLLPDGTEGDTLFQVFSIPDHACQPVPPADVKVVARRIPIPLFGAGLVEAIPDSEIAARADPDDLDSDGVSGRAAVVEDIVTGELRVGRFGWKSQLATLRDFAGDAYRNEMGITNEIFPLELAFGISPEKMTLCDPIPDPEDFADPVTGLSGVDNFVSFMQFLAPPSRAATRGKEQRGEDLFRSIGCSSCHVPTLRTGPSDNRLFDRQPVPLFSDLLLHDIGTGDGIGQADAAPNEIRTPALWGLRFRRILLHDGSAGSVGAAIQRHEGEAAAARKAYRRLDKASRQALLDFLRSL